MTAQYVLEMKGISKAFPGVKTLNDMQFQLKKGEIHALMGENGAGKSTFIKIITGVHQPTEGDMYLSGEKVAFQNPKQAQQQGIAAIYQHVTSYPDLSVTENIFMNHEISHPIWKTLNWREMHKQAKQLLRDLGSSLDPKAQMNTLSVAQQQIVEIAKAISTKAKIIIMDEPTAALTARESEELYRITEKLRDEGTSIIFISHRFEDMYRLASRVTVLRDSNYIGTWEVDEISNEKLIVAMVGREINQIFPDKKTVPKETVLEVKNLTKLGAFDDISFSIKRGEILGMTGLVGAGRTEVCQAIFGITSFDKGEIVLNGEAVRNRNPQQAMNNGIGYLAEDRLDQGLLVDWSIEKNITLANLAELSTATWLHRNKEKQQAKEFGEKVQIKATGIFDPVSSLSGGNQQKVAVAKLLTKDLKVILLDEPTKGVDIGAKAAIYEIIQQLADAGYAVLFVSSEMPEILGMSDRIIVMKDGRIAADFVNKGITQEMILEAAMGEEQVQEKSG
ncbi:sugar ABC transporter ATP-binding protein [Terribacillus saccharophilus]|uniref:sugar ABC transporter ATP-binding protein n=1 Tax=Terribacillus saccharophilus TaxID=361277 RepID=UPI003981F8D3